MDDGLLATPLLSAAHFSHIGSLLHRLCGIALAPGKEALVTARLVKRLRALGLTTFDDYLRALDGDASGAEVRAMIDALTTNKTSFFREPEHFAYLREAILPGLTLGTEPIRIWSAGCSTGEEPYSLAITLRDELPDPDRRDARILATDISDRVLAGAREALYDQATLVDVPRLAVARHFHRVAVGGQTLYRPNDTVRGMVALARLNLLADWPMRGSFDLIFCRNVMIYFDNPTRERIVARFWGLLRPGGHLFVGTAESLTSIAHPFRYVRPAIFLKPPELTG